MPDGRQQRGKLEVLSLNGGLLNMPNTLEQGSRLKLLFVTNTGPVLGAVEMLRPVSMDRQAFRFVGVERADQLRLRSTVQSFSSPQQDAWIDKYRAAVSAPPPQKKGIFHYLLRSLILLAL
jgi:hypothetical protein